MKNTTGPARSDPATVSIVIPCFNYAGYLGSCIESALSQDGVRVKVVVVDDASTDASVKVARSYARPDSRVSVISHERNLGPVATFNDGLARVDGEFIVRLDADDLLTPGSLARAVALFDAFPTVGLVYGHPVHFSLRVPAGSRDAVRHWTVWPGTAWLERRCREGVNCITSPEVVLRRSVVQRAGGQRELAQTHDMEMWMRMAAVSDIGYLAGPDQALHREHPTSRSARMVDVMTDLRERRLAFEMVFDGVGSSLSDASRLRGMAKRALAAEALTRACHAYDRNRVATTPVEELIEFALDTSPEATRLRQWRALLRRTRVGARMAHRVPPFVAAAAFRRLRDQIAYKRWSLTGL